MARAKRHYIPGHVWHLTHRCHKKDFLLKYIRDKRRYLQWLFEAKRRYKLTILNYAITSNHIHLLVLDDGEKDTVARSMHLVAGRFAQEYNERKKRKGAYWQDRYHATAIETGEHLLRCLAYIDLNMVRAGVVKHPSEWMFGGYREIQTPRRKCVLIAYDKLATLVGYQDFQRFQKAHKELVDHTLYRGNIAYDGAWTQSIAVGSEQFVRSVKSCLGSKALGRNIQKALGGYELKESESFYNAEFDPKKGNIGLDNTFEWAFF